MDESSTDEPIVFFGGKSGISSIIEEDDIGFVAVLAPLLSSEDVEGEEVVDEEVVDEAPLDSEELAFDSLSPDEVVLEEASEAFVYSFFA